MNGRQVATTLVIMSDVEYLLPLDIYQQHFVHIGTQQSSAHMKPFLEDKKQEGTGLYLINLDETNKRFSIVSNFLSKYDPADILVVSARQYGQRPARRFAQAIGARHIVGRFIPGTLTNPRLRSYIEPKVIIVTDPQADQQALSEAVNSGLPVVGICDANNTLRFVDIVLPANNKGRRSLALVYWLLAREVVKAQGRVNDDQWAAAEDVEDWESSF
ncbi:MAG: 30S ribosomal protein S2 [Euryarchaeota archaeon]|jgi:small subunit ribosomal protein S2|nr:30S ribosomal protein S2 [Euryarchaeota archaeon]|tara:strand:- start:195 stop:842 length:648 start_codon:yes stop_codon:yes gene_type:complete